MTNKQRDTLAGQIISMCIVAQEVRQELRQAQAPKEVLKQARETWEALDKLLRVVSCMNEN